MDCVCWPRRKDKSALLSGLSKGTFPSAVVEGTAALAGAQGLELGLCGTSQLFPGAQPRLTAMWAMGCGYWLAILPVPTLSSVAVPGAL